MILVLFSALSLVSASDISDNATDQSTLKVANVQQNILGEGQKTFDELDSVINNDSIPEYGTVELDSDYTFSDSDISSVGTDGISIDKSITIDGKGHTLNASNKAAIFKINNNARVILKNIVFTSGNASDGGAIYVESGSSFEIIDCTFSNNFASNNGGAIFINADSLASNSFIINSIFTNNVASNGGAIYASASTLNITRSDFSHNNASINGGSLFINGVVNINQATFDHNYANAGGSIYLMGDGNNHSTIDFSTFTNCTATGDGGACYIYSDNVVLKNSKFFDNVAGDDGGALHWKGSYGIIDNISSTNNKGISENTSSSRGGTICLTGDNVTVTKSHFISSSVNIDTGRDSSKLDGGALFITGNNVNIIETEFNDCNAVNKGGAIYILGNNSKILDCNLSYTEALIGGAIFIEGNNATIDYSLFRHNTASNKAKTGGSGGAIYVEGDEAKISNSDFAYGETINYGGAISVWGANANITKNVFDNCTTTLYYGGSIFVNGENASISLSNFTRSKAENKFAQGGAIQVSGSNAIVDECNFEYCFAYYGGDIYISGTNAIVNNSDFKHSTTFKPTGTSKVQSPQWGAAIYVSGEYGSILNSNFTNFIAEEYGGAICIQGANTIINGSHFDNCNAKSGGDIFVFGNNAKIEESTFNTSSANYGGAIYLTAWGAVVKHINVTSCVASYSGGAIYVAGGGTTIIESNFEKCNASGQATTYGGGALYLAGSYNNIVDSNFTDNRVTYSDARGGTIYISSGEGTNIRGSYFNNSYAGNGGIIFMEGDEVIISTSTFANSSSKDKGGAISIQGHNATIQDSIFENFTSFNGGAIYVDGESSNILRSSFVNCVAKYDGGAININDVGTTVAYSNFTLSKATNTGGAIFIQGENTTVTYCNLDNNTANVAGAIYINGQNTLISRSILDNNTANVAGAIKVSGSNTIVTDCNLTHNIATTSSGGAMDLSGENASVLYSNFYFNDAKTYGGAINWEGGHGDDSIIGSTFVNNTGHGAGMGGGAIFWTASKGGKIGSGGLIKDSIFINNTAHGHHGGAIDWFHALDSTIDNCLFINNTAAADGGALYTGDKNGNSLNFTIINSQFYNNTAGKHGGAIANQMTSCYIYNSTFDGNKAGSSGGSILMKEAGGKNSVIDHCYIYNTYCYVGDKYGESGGAIHIGASDTNVTISNCAIINSTCIRDYGGAISVKSQDSSLINVTIQNVGTPSGYGGAIYWSGNYGTLNNVTIFNSSSQIVDNSKSADGGAIYLSGTHCNLNDITITNSSSNIVNSNLWKTSYGGAIFVGGSDNTLTNVNIDDSQALSVKMDTRGGAIFWSGSSGTLINATISNTLANGQGGAIYWSGGSPTVENISIEYSQTNVINSSNTADGGAIYSISINNLNNVYIVDSLASTNVGDVKGGAIYYNGLNMNNVTVIGSRASTDDGTTYGGAIYWVSGGNGNLYNSSFENNTADFGGAVFSDRTTSITGTTFEGNVALDGGALYGRNGDDTITNSIFVLNSAKRGGAIFAEKVNFKIDYSTLMNNTAEEKGGAIYRNHNGASYIRNSNLTNNTAFQGSAIYTTTFFELTNVILLDNQANSKEFIEKTVGVDEYGNNYTSAIFVGYDNLLNAIWDEENTVSVSCNNVIYWGVNGLNVSNSIPVKSDREVWQNITVEMFDGNGVKIKETEVVTDALGKFKYIFEAKEGENYYFAYTHKTDRYYTYLRETMSNRSLIKVYALTPIYYNQNQTILISLTDGAWGEISGNITLEINGPINATFEIEVINGTWTRDNISGLPLGDYNVSASFAGDLNHTGDSDWVLFTVLPYLDLDITKDVNITADFVNVSDIIEYTINVTNHGPSNATGVNVTEHLSPYLRLISNETTHGYYNLTNGTWYIGDLELGETATLTITAEIIHMGPITNTVWVYGDGNDTNLTNNVASARNFTAVPLTDLRIKKEINVVNDTIDVLDEIKFTITVYNDGPSNATGVYVYEALDDHLSLISYETSDGSVYHGDTWQIGNLANGANVTLTITARVIYSGNITNAVTVYGFENETNYTNNHDSIKNITAIANVDVGVIKTVNVTGYVNVTDFIEFNITVYNNGPCNASGVYVAEVLDSHLELVSYNTTNNSTYDGYTWVVGYVNTGEPVILTIVAKVISNGTIANAVSVKSTDNDTDPDNDNDTIDNITALNIVDLEITKEVTKGGSVVNVSDEIEFKITVTNHGPCAATNVTVSEVLSPYIEMTYNNTWQGYYNVNEGMWHIGDLANGSSVVLVLGCKVISRGIISNVVIVSSNENDTNISNNNDTIDNITSTDALDLNITKVSNITSGVVNVTEFIKYTITVHNNGPSNANQVNVSEILSPCLRLSKNETTQGYYDVNDGIWYIGNITVGSTVELTLVCEVICNGTIDNVVVVTSYENDTDPDNNRAELIIISKPVVDLRIVKTSNVTSTEIDVNDVIQFTVTVFNDGPCNATGVFVQEPLSPRLNMINYTTSDGSAYDGYTWVIGDMTNGTNVTLTITAQVAYSDAIENFVVVFGNEFDINESNNYDNITNITAFAHVDVGVIKTVNVSGVVNVSDLIEFVVTVYNNGPCNASGVIVVEALDSHLEMISYNTTNNSTYDGYSWIVGNVNVGEPVNLTIVAQVISPGTFGNFVAVSCYDNDTNPDNDNDTIDNITAVSIVDLDIIKEVTFGGSVVNVSDIVEFSITVINKGPCDATNVTVSEVLSPHLEMTYNSTWIGYYNVTEGIWHIGTLAKYTNVTLVIQARVISNGTISNFVCVNSNENDTNTSNNNDTIDEIVALPLVDLEIAKRSNITFGIVNVTDYIEYTIVVRNNGPSNATQVNVSEVLSPALRLSKSETDYGYYNVTEGIWHIGNLTNGSAVELTLVCEVIGRGIIDNVVVVTGYENESNPYNNRAELVIISNAIVDLRVVKTVNVTSSEIDVTDVIQFNVTVFNDGPCNATGVFVLEPLSSLLSMINYTTSDGSAYDGYTWVIGDMTNGTNVTLTITAQVAYSDAIENFVVVFGNEFDINESNNYDNITNITAFAHVDVGVIKTVNVSGVVNVSDLIEFVVTVYNNGPCNASGVIVVEALDSHLEMISYNTTNNSTYDGYSWIVGNVDVGEPVNLTIVAQVISPGTFGNFVAVSCYDNDTNPDNDNDTIDNITAVSVVDLEIIKEVTIGGSVVNVSDIVEFSITVINKGPCDATNVTVSEVLSPHLEMTYNSTWIGYYNVTEGIWHIGTLARYTNVTLVIQARVISNGTISNFVSVNSTENDTDPSNNNDTIDNITALPVVDLFISKSCFTPTGSNMVNLGDVILYMVYVQNNGPSNATGVVVNETLSNLVELTGKRYEPSPGTNYDPGTGLWTIGNLNNGANATLSIWVKVIRDGIIENVVFINSTENDTNPDNDNASSDNITALGDVDLEITKEVTLGGNVVNVSDIVEFTITVHNNGPCDATGVNVSEVLSPHLRMISNVASSGYYDVVEGVWHVGVLANQSSVSLVIRALVVSEGIIENVVVVSSNENETDPDDNNDSIDNITALPIVDLEINKTSNAEGKVVIVGDIIEFTITVRNNGPCDASGVNVSEVLSPHLRMVSYDTENGYYSLEDSMWYIGNLANKSVASLKIKVQVISEGIIENVVNVTSNENDTNPDDNNDSIDNITAVIKTDVSVEKTVSVTQAHIGDVITYTITVHNAGPNNATNVNVTEKLSTTYVKLIESIPSTGNYDSTDSIWYVGKLDNGSTETLTLKVQLISEGIVENVVSVSATENDTNITNNNYTCDNVTVSRPDTPIDLVTYNITYGEDEILVVRLPDDASGTVNITVGDRTYNEVPIDKGVVTLPVSDLGAGDYTVNVTYGGDDKYLPNSTSGKFTVLPVVPIIKIEVVDIWVGEVEVLNVTVNAPGTVNITVNGITIEVPLNESVTTTNVLKAFNPTDYNGKATWNLVNLPAGRYPAFAVYNGNENYSSVNTSDVFLVKKLPSTVSVTVKDIYVGEDAIVRVKVGPAGVTGNVTITIEGKKYTAKINDGRAEFVIHDLKAGIKQVSVRYSGDDKYLSSKNSTTFKVKKHHPPIDSTTHDIEYGKDETIVVHLPEDATGKVTIVVDGKKYTSDVRDGKATFKIHGLKPGKYDVNVHYSGNGKYYSAKTTNDFKVIKKSIPHNDTNTTTHKVHNGIDLTKNPTGNPLFVLLLILFAVGSISYGRFRKQ